MHSVPLILGGHSFIAQLGNDPRPTKKQTDAIVTACLDAGIRRFDTTYRPERIALGASLKRLRRRSEAHLIAWNFFHLFDDDEPVGTEEALREGHLDEILDDFQTDFLDELVVHPVFDVARQNQQESLAIGWKATQRVGRLGTWSPGEKLEEWEHRTAYDFVVEPCNLFTPQAESRIALYHRLGLEVYGCSPFVRGWQLDKMVAAAHRDLGPTEARARVADHLLRYALFQPHVAALIVAMRRTEWIAANLASVERGPLSSSQHDWLQSLKSSVVEAA